METKQCNCGTGKKCKFHPMTKIPLKKMNKLIDSKLVSDPSPMDAEQQKAYDLIERLDGCGLVITDYDLLVESIKGEL